MRASAAGLGEALASCRSQGRLAELALHLIGSGPAAEDVQDEAVAAMEDNLAGYFATATTASTRRLLQCDEPVFGPLLAGSVLVDGSALRLPAGVLGAEWSLGLILGEPCPDPHRPIDAALLDEAVIACMPMITVLGRRVRGRIPLNSWTATADFGLHVASAKGTPVFGRRLADLAGLAVVASMNGAVVGRSRGAAVAGDLAAGILALLDHLQRRERQVPPGAVIAIGGGPLILQAVPGQTFRADFGDLGAVEIAFT